MNQQSNESHLGFTDETSRAVYRNNGIGQFRFDNSGSIVIPEIRRDNQSFQDRGRQNAEVAKPRIESHNQAMDRSVDRVEKLENKPFRAESPRGENHFTFTLGNELFQQARYVGGGIFAVGVHDDHWGGDAALPQVNQTDTQGTLVPQVGSQFHTLDLLYIPRRSCRKL